MAGDDAGASGSGVAPTAAAAASAAARHHHLPWEAVLHLVVPHLREQDDRATVRKVSREWKAAADAAWTRGAVWSDEPFPPFVWRLRELCLVDDYSGGSSRTTVQIFRLTKQPLTALRALVLSAELGFQGSLGTSVLEHLAICGMPRLQRLELQNVVVAPRSGNLACLACFNELTELSLSRLSSLPNDASALAVGGVHHLTGLRSLQALSLPLLDQADRQALAAFTALTRLSFMAGGTGAVGPSLAGLTRLQRMTISLAHVHEMFIVKHPHIEWAALRALSALRCLRIHHLCTFSFLPSAEGWSGDVPVSVEAEQLLGALPCIEELELRLSFCRLRDGEGGVSELLPIPHPSSTRPRRFLRAIEATAVRAPGRRHDDSWFAQWWQAPIQLDRTAGMRERFLAERGEVAGWMALRPGNHRTHDVLVTYVLQGAAAASSAAPAADSG